jgi:hypothetical protein
MGFGYHGDNKRIGTKTNLWFAPLHCDFKPEDVV